MKKVFCFLFFLSSIGLSFAQDNRDSSRYSTGQTINIHLEYDGDPHFQVKSDKKIDGKPIWKSWLLIKAKLNGVFDIEGGLQDQETFNIGKIDVWGTDNSPRFWMDMHQTQFRLYGERLTNNGKFIGYLEGDFWAGNKVFRLRHCWVDYKFIHFGQDWSFFGDKEIWPNVLDWDGPSSGVWRREPMLKFYKDYDHWEYEWGVELPGAELTLDQNVDSSLSSAYQPIPDFIATVKHKGHFGHVRLAGILRNLEYKANGENKRVPGYGAALSGYVHTQKQLGGSFQFQAVGGVGIATYLVSFSGLNYDGVPGGNGTMNTIPTMGGWVAWEHYLSKKWHFNVIGGFSWFQSDKIPTFEINGPGYTTVNTSVAAEHQYFLVNLMFDPVPELIFGLEYNLGRKENIYEGNVFTGNNTVLQKLDQGRTAQRISFGVFYNF